MYILPIQIVLSKRKLLFLPNLSLVDDYIYFTSGYLSLFF